jgi:hypothetical protein
VGVELGQLSLMKIIEELFEKKKYRLQYRKSRLMALTTGYPYTR